MIRPDVNKITLLAMDVDGVLTDGGLIIHADGSESKRFHVHDGAWIRIWARLGFKTAIITGRQCPAVDHRARDLNIDYVYQNAKRKLEVFEQLLADSGIPAENMAYIGDDVMDLPVLNRVGFRAVVDNALDEIKSFAHYVTNRPGGEGAVGELIIHLLRKKGLWEQAMERYRI
ncbi:MAG: HAD hydrolase family protein [Sedimentisphaerales bacterium]|nr:HAD hydrolase family protein [Sedimentisphaerales bacterium]